MILYMYKIHIGLNPNVGFEKVYNFRTKVKFSPKFNPRAPTTVKSLRYSSFFNKGPMLYNRLPEDMRELENFVTPDKLQVAKFKTKMDKWLELIPDQPGTDGLLRAARSNSIVDQLRTHGIEVTRKWRIIRGQI